MQSLFKLFWGILVLRHEPAEVPYSKQLCYLVVAIHWLMGMLLISLSSPIGKTLFSATTSTIITVVFVHIMLITHRFDSRWVQTLTALAGVEILLALFSVPLTLLYLSGYSEGLLIGLLSLVIIGWNALVAAHIFTGALDGNKGLGFAYAVFYLIIAIISSSVFA